MKKAAVVIIGLMTVGVIALAVVLVPKMACLTTLIPTTTTNSTQVTTTPVTEARLSAVLTSALGRVEILKPGGSWTSAAIGAKLEKGDTIRTGDSAIATVTFFDGSTIDLKFATEIKVVDLQQQADQKTISLSQQVGQTVSRVTQLIDPASRYDVETPAAFAAVRGSEMFVSVEKDGLTLVGNIEGDIRAIAANQEVIIPEGMHCIIFPGEAPGKPRAGANPIMYRTPVMIDPQSDLFGQGGNAVTGAGYLDIVRSEVYVILTSLTEGELTLRMQLASALPDAQITPSRLIEWDFLTDLDRNPDTGMKWPLVANDMGYDFLIRLGLQGGKYQSTMLTVSSNTWQPVEYRIEGNVVEIYLKISDLIPSVGGLITGPGDLYWMVATMLYNPTDADNQPSVIDKAPNEGHYSLMS